MPSRFRPSQELSPTAIVAVERGLRAQLAQHLAGESTVSEMVHAVLAVMAAVIIWPAARHVEALSWMSSIILAAFLRGLLRTRRRQSSDAPALIIRDIRVGVALLALSWAWGILFIGSDLPLELLALLTVILAGIVAGATIALLADPVSYYMMTGGLLVPLVGAVLLNGTVYNNATAAFLIVVFGSAMLVYHRRSHDAYLTQIRTARELVETTARAQAASDEAARMAEIIEATTDHVGIGSPDGSVRYMNRAGRAMLGIGADEDVTRLSFRDVTPPRIHDTVAQHMAAVAREGTWSGESALLHRDGREIPVSLVAIAHRDDQGAVESMSFVARDVSEQVAAHQAMEAARDAAEQTAAAKSAFLANTSHEIRTPLNGILGMVELLLDTELTAAQRRSVELIASAGETLLATINDVLDLSKIEAGQMEFETIPFDLHHVVHSTVRLLSARATAKDLELVSAVEDDVPERVMGDPHRLKQVLTNLVGNAIKFTNHGEVVVSVRRLPDDGGGRVRVRVAVRDTGIGIAREHLDRIFDPFRQVDASTTRQYGGTGLGLSIARRLVAMMKGTLAVDSTPGAGSEFHFTAEFEPAPDDAAAPLRASGSLRGVRALVVDDHQTNRRVLCDMLRWAGADVRDAGNVHQALTMLRDARDGEFRLVVSDVQMPERDGFDLAAELHANDRLRACRVMLLTSASRPGDSQRCRELGVAAYMQKPVSRVELVEAALAALAEGDAHAHTPTLVTRQKLEETRVRLRVLVAEDNPVNQEVAASLLRRRGHEVAVVANGREAVEAVARDPSFDVVLMDLQMPEQDGLSATRAIRDAGHGALPIVALTANVSAGERERCMAAGMSGYLAKPFKPHELYATVEGWAPDVASAAAVGPDAAAPVDLAGFRQMLADAGIDAAGPKMIDAFLADSAPRVAKIRDAADRRDLQALAAETHRMASGASAIYARELARLLRAAEKSANEGDASAAIEAAGLVAAELARVEAYLGSNS